ncbi:ASCH domain-containing protein [Streptomyces sp. XD-27]|uniref:ASCH domain-containing protein n=1 Tax=Streptomyces sp. XD-27 TaxID=3062779 RepID=UPI0026F41A71|nr:ASCH domain-containing protein [Streptomyces sp. XD-27]WKX68723.1 ASCH domain-containing protein [Streptomyces sp. XD-27]
MTRHDDLPKAEFAFPGPVRDQLVAAILSGAKTSTTTLDVEFEIFGEPIPVVGERQVVVDSQDRPVAVIEITEVRKLTVGEIDLQHVIDEGEGDETIAQWRASHERFWHSPQMREALGDPGFTVTDDTPVVADRFRVVERLDPAAP